MNELTCPNCGMVATEDGEPSIQHVDTVDTLRAYLGMRDGKPLFSSLADVDWESCRNDRLFCQACLHEWKIKLEDIDFE